MGPGMEYEVRSINKARVVRAWITGVQNGCRAQGNVLYVPIPCINDLLCQRIDNRDSYPVEVTVVMSNQRNRYFDKGACILVEQYVINVVMGLR